MSNSPAARILIVDDEAAQMKALCDTLKDHGYETTGFTAGKDALAALKRSLEPPPKEDFKLRLETRFDLLLSDLMMPEMNGIAVLRAAFELDPDLVGIMMTGEGTITSAVEAMKAGALDYILKPFKLSLILPVLARALAIRQLRLDKAELERDLHQRTVQLEAANKELEAFSYSVSHDLRAPLRAINGFSRILAETYAPQLPEEAQELLNDVAASAKRMDRLIEDLLCFSRMARQPLSRRPVQISALVNEVLQELQRDQSDRQIEICVSDLPDSFGDPALLKQVFVNLLSNAFKFTRQTAQAKVLVGCERRPGEEGRENVCENVYFVRDNGAGFNMRYADKLFGVFQRMHSAEQFEGTGVGLSIVQRIVQRHGGRIWAEAEPNKGAAFFFTLEEPSSEF